MKRELTCRTGDHDVTACVLLDQFGKPMRSIHPNQGEDASIRQIAARPSSRKTDGKRKRRKWGQAALVWSNIVLAGTAVFTITCNIRQLKLTREALVSSAQSTAISQRAYLSAGEPRNALGRGLVFTLPIRNQGHTPCPWVKGRIRYERFNAEAVMKEQKRYGTVPTIEQRTIEVTFEKPVPPDQADHSITIMLPALRTSEMKAINDNRQGLFIRGKFEYDTGFNSTDKFGVCARYDSHLGRWQKCGNTVASIDLGQTPPVLPE